jgi:hypothetical protein
MNSTHLESQETRAIARRSAALLCVLPLWNCLAAAAMGVLVVYSDADDQKFLAGLLSAANVGGWLWWLYGSLVQIRDSIRRWVETPHNSHPGFRLAGLISLVFAVSWVGVLFLLAYGMLA